MQAYPLLAEKDRPRIINYDCQRQKKKQRGEHNNSAGGKYNIQRPFPKFSIQINSLFLLVFDTNTHYSIPQNSLYSKEKFYRKMEGENTP